MIQLVKRADLDVEKYDACIEQSVQSNLFGFSWYLDIVADNWSVLVLDDYMAVMPIPFRRKYGITYLYQPLWMIQLGMYSIENNVSLDDFIPLLQRNFKHAEFRLNTFNLPDNDYECFQKKTLQFISLEDNYEEISKKYNRNRRRELTKANKADLVENWNDDPKQLVLLFKENIAGRLDKIKQEDFDNLLQVMKVSIDKKVGELLTIYTQQNQLVSAAFFIKYKHKITQVVCASDIKNRDNGVNTFSNDRAIYKYQKHYDVYNFGGSSMKTIAKYYTSFGAKTEVYPMVKYNKLPFLLRFFKR